MSKREKRGRKINFVEHWLHHFKFSSKIINNLLWLFFLERI
jgi:hypothetical protein